jgi:hypothetical protein
LSTTARSWAIIPYQNGEGAWMPDAISAAFCSAFLIIIAPHLNGICAVVGLSY